MVNLIPSSYPKTVNEIKSINGENHLHPGLEICDKFKDERNSTFWCLRYASIKSIIIKAPNQYFTHDH